MTELSEREAYLESPTARKHGVQWFRERLLVFVPDLPQEQVDDKPGILRAMSTVVTVTEAPFLESYQRVYEPMMHFVCAGSAVAGNDHRPHIAQALNIYGKQHGRLFRPRFQDVTRPDITVKGTFLGSAVFVPEANEIPRGFLSLRIHEGDAGRPIAEGRAVFAGSDGVPAAFYTGQDRAVLGNGNGMPVIFGFENSDIRSWLRADIMLILLPAKVESPKPRLLVTRMDGEASRLLNQDQAHVSKAGEKVAPQALVTGDAVPDETLSELMFDDQTGEALCPLPRIVHGGQNRYSASLRLVPNDAVCRLRHDMPTNVDNFFSIMGLLLPSPVADNDSSEVCLNFQANGHLVGHPFDGLSSCTLLRAATGMGSRVFRIMDEAILADTSGVTDVVRLQDGAKPDPLGTKHQALLLSARKKPGITLANPLNGSGLLANFGRKRQFYLITHRENDGVFGYFACPTRHGINKGDIQPGETDRINRAQVTFSREEQAGKASCCLDWLDEAVQVTYHKAGSGGQYEPMGFARYWREQSHWLGTAAAAQQFELYSGPGEGERYALSFVERLDNREERVALKRGDVIRIGPLICRYHHTSGS